MKRLPWRSALYLLVLLYLLFDLKVCNGPLKRKIAESRPSSSVTRERALELGWVALVNQEPVTESRLRMAVSRYLYQRGKSRIDLTKEGYLDTKRAALSRLIDDILIRQYCDGEEFEAPAKESEAFAEAWKSQFPSAENLDERLRAQDLTIEEAEAELARIWSRKRWLEQRIAPGIGITDEELRDWFERARAEGGYVEPEKIRARQIFVSTVENDTDEEKGRIETARRRIVEGEEFAAVAAELSEDERTKQRGGDLNWFSRGRLPEEFTSVVFGQETGQLGRPFKTKIGWHLVEVTDRQAAREVRFEEVKDEIRTHLTNQQERATLQTLLGKLRKASNIVVFTENL